MQKIQTKILDYLQTSLLSYSTNLGPQGATPLCLFFQSVSYSESKAINLPCSWVPVTRSVNKPLTPLKLWNVRFYNNILGLSVSFFKTNPQTYNFYISFSFKCLSGKSRQLRRKISILLQPRKQKRNCCKLNIYLVQFQ